MAHHGWLTFFVSGDTFCPECGLEGNICHAEEIYWEPLVALFLMCYSYVVFFLERWREK